MKPYVALWDAGFFAGTIFLNARSKSFGELLVPNSRAVSRMRLARSSSVMVCFLAGITKNYRHF